MKHDLKTFMEKYGSHIVLPAEKYIEEFIEELQQLKHDWQHTTKRNDLTISIVIDEILGENQT